MPAYPTLSWSFIFLCFNPHLYTTAWILSRTTVWFVNASWVFRQPPCFSYITIGTIQVWTLNNSRQLTIDSTVPVVVVHTLYYPVIKHFLDRSYSDETDISRYLRLPISSGVRPIPLRWPLVTLGSWSDASSVPSREMPVRRQRPVAGTTTGCAVTSRWQTQPPVTGRNILF